MKGKYPWSLEKRQENHHIIKRSRDYLPMIADVYGTDAEARLIASAPNLLAVVERLQEWAEAKTSDWFDDLQANNVHQAPNLSEIIQAANEAVAEAKGGE